MANVNLDKESPINVNLSTEKPVETQLQDLNYIPAYKDAEKTRRENEETRIANEVERQKYYEVFQTKVNNNEFVGPSNVLTIGDVSSGDEAKASITGDTPNQVLNLVLPKGDKGDIGPKGEPGESYAAGDGIQISSDNVISTVETDPLFSTSPASSITTDDIEKWNNNEGAVYTAGKNIEIAENNVINNTIPFAKDDSTNFVGLGKNLNYLNKNLSLIIGNNISSANNIMLIGHFASHGNHNNSIALGHYAQPSKDNQLMVGSFAKKINEISFYTSDGIKTAATTDSVADLQNQINEIIENGTGGGTSIIKDTFPIGAITPFAGSTVPTHWLLCNGQAISRADYSDLFAAIGTTYGEGDGSTTFNVPDLRGRVAVGIDTTDTNLNVLGKTYGEKEHTLTVEEIPEHAHAINSFRANGSSYGGVLGTNASDGVSTGQKGTTSVGENQPHNNMQPSIAQNFIIKVKQFSGSVIGGGSVVIDRWEADE
ncbi:phage tail protein [uncultured Thomasclavelia sp.]|uniref:phage tail protein n=1 Tax=uncultured Thomasclavelia sp. TaxID=3025759 RepID=UPI00259450FD|nr:tail fiber protein [uncultured Thomasclavelia sp.]